MKYEEVKAKLIELFKSQSGDEWSESYEIIDDTNYLSVYRLDGDFRFMLGMVSKGYELSMNIQAVVGERMEVSGEVARLLFELASTPLDSRMDEQCFMIKVLQSEDGEEDRYIAFDKNSNSFELVSPAFVTNEVQTVFTASEIDYMKRVGELKVDWDSVLEEV